MADDEIGVLETYRSFFVNRAPQQLSAAVDRLYAMADPGRESAPVEEEIEIELTTVNQGMDAVEAAKRAIEVGLPYAVALLDMRMPPGIDGLETAKRLREVDPSIHIVIVTAFSDFSSDQIRSEIQRNMLYYQKPFSQEEIRQVVLNACLSWDRDKELEEVRASLEKKVLERTHQVERLAKFQQYQAFRSGMEEMSISVMHDIGNALTGAMAMAQEIQRRSQAARDVVFQLEPAFKKHTGEELQQLQADTLSWIEAGVLRSQQEDINSVLEGLQRIQQVIMKHQQTEGGGRDSSVVPLDINGLLDDFQVLMTFELEPLNVEVVCKGASAVMIESVLTPPRFIELLTRLFEYIIEQFDESRGAGEKIIEIEVKAPEQHSNIELCFSWSGAEDPLQQEQSVLFQHPALHFVSNQANLAGGSVSYQRGICVTLPRMAAAEKQLEPL